MAAYCPGWHTGQQHWGGGHSNWRVFNAGAGYTGGFFGKAVFYRFGQCC